jgi:hypothetical protein
MNTDREKGKKGSGTKRARADAVACLPVPRAYVFFPHFLFFAWWLVLLFLVRRLLID